MEVKCQVTYCLKPVVKTTQKLLGFWGGGGLTALGSLPAHFYKTHPHKVHALGPCTAIKAFTRQQYSSVAYLWEMDLFLATD